MSDFSFHLSFFILKKQPRFLTNKILKQKKDLFESYEDLFESHVTHNQHKNIIMQDSKVLLTANALITYFEVIQLCNAFLEEYF